MGSGSPTRVARFPVPASLARCGAGSPTGSCTLLAMVGGVNHVQIVPLMLGVASGALVAHTRQGRENAERLAAALLETLLNAVDANDPDTGAHVRRVARYALILAEAADLDEHAQRAVER